MMLALLYLALIIALACLLGLWEDCREVLEDLRQTRHQLWEIQRLLAEANRKLEAYIQKTET